MSRNPLPRAAGQGMRSTWIPQGSSPPSPSMVMGGCCKIGFGGTEPLQEHWGESGRPSRAEQRDLWTNPDPLLSASLMAVLPWGHCVCPHGPITPLPLHLCSCWV